MDANSGSGKSTYARAQGTGHGVAYLDLDSIVWERGQVAVQRPAEAIRQSTRAAVRGRTTRIGGSSMLTTARKSNTPVSQCQPRCIVTREDVRSLVDYHYWARDRLLEACVPLTPDQFTRDLSSSFPSIRDTLVHLYTADWGWYLLWQGQPLTDPPLAGSFPDLASVRRAWQGQESQVRAFVATLGEESIGGFWRKLMHLVNHASYHRGQVTTLLRQLGVDAPESQDMIIFDKERSSSDPGRVA